jgi:SAM-dependent methyltransferase
MTDRIVVRNIIRAYLPQFLKSPYRTGGTDSAGYCYAIWLRHLSMIQRAGLATRLEVVAELGPGDSIGIGLASLLGGAQRYTGLDAARLAATNRNLALFDELVALFRCRAPIPDDQEYPRIRPHLASYEFPASILTETDLESSLAPDRVAALRRELSNLPADHAPNRAINYIAPWGRADPIAPGSQDLVFSQAVLQSVTDIAAVYACMSRWLRPGGVMSHSISMESLGSASRWNGHWTYSDTAWRLVNGFSGHGVNREPMSGHLRLIRDGGFEIVDLQTTRRGDGIARRELAARFRHLDDDDLQTNGFYVLALKR